MAGYRFVVDGEVQVSRAFQELAEGARDLSEPFRYVADALLEAVREQFESEGAHGLGSRWRPLNPEYAAWKQARYPGRKILVRTGGMKGAFLNRQQSTRVTPRSLVYEPRVDYAAPHQRGEGRVPQRKIVALSVADRRKWDRIFLHYLRHTQGRTAAWPPTFV